MQSVDLSIIIPCFNEGPTFSQSVSRIESVLNKTKYNWEIIFVEDKSTDETKRTVEEIVNKSKNKRAIFHTTNQGRGKTVSDGILASGGKICGFLDVDLEVSAEYIPLFVAEIENGSDVAIGMRFYESGSSSLARVLASRTYALIVKLFVKLPIKDSEAGYKFFNRKNILPILKKTKDKGWFWDTEICARAYWAGLRVSQIPVLFVKRVEKKSTVRLVPDSLEYLSKIIKFRSQAQLHESK